MLRLNREPLAARPGESVMVASILTCVLSLLFWLGCVAPVRVPTHTQGPAGAHAKVDLNFLHVGTTTRAEVVRQMGWADAGINNERLFLGRWMDSKWVVAWAVAGGGPDSGGSGFGGTPRVWHTHSLIVEFNEKAVVTHYHVVHDDMLPKELSASVQRVYTPTLNLSAPIVISVKHRRGQHYEPAVLSLLKDSVELSKPETPASGFKITPEQITGLSYVNGLKDESPDPQSTNYCLHFSEKTAVGKKLTIRIDMPALAVLVQYLAESRKP